MPSRVAVQISAYRTLVATARKRAATDEPRLNAAIEAFEPQFFNNMALALDGYIVHSAGAKEQKDGNPPNAVRMLCNTMMNNNNVLCTDKTIKSDPATSVLKYRIGVEIKLNEAGFMRLSSAFFAEIEGEYS